MVRDRPLAGRDAAAAYLKTIAEAVHYAHEHGILHRDLKPSNILIDASDQPRITDFGLAKRLTVRLGPDPDRAGAGLAQLHVARTGRRAARQAIGPASDVYALGAMLYHLLTRRPPFQADTLTTLLKQVLEAEPVPPRSAESERAADLETICLKCLEKELRRRYATAQALAEDLGRFLQDEPILARPVSAVARLEMVPATTGAGGADGHADRGVCFGIWGRGMAMAARESERTVRTTKHLRGGHEPGAAGAGSQRREARGQPPE